MFEYVFLISRKDKKLNLVKIWFASQFLRDYKFSFHFENEINFDKIVGDKIFLISLNIFPLLNSFKIENFIQEKPKIFIKNNDFILFISKDELKQNIKNLLDLEILKEPLFKICSTNINLYSYKWIVVNDYENFYEILNRKYFTWKNLNLTKLRISRKYPNIIYYDGKNKLESKRLIQKLNIPIPKTYKIFKKVDEINLNGLPDNFIIKPTNLDGSKHIIRFTKNEVYQLEDIKYQLRNFKKFYKNKELTKLINRHYQPKILIEEFIPSFNNEFTSPCELKFYVFKQEIKFILATYKDINEDKFGFYDKNFNNFPNEKYSFNSSTLNYIFPKLKYFENLKKDVLKIAGFFKKDLPCYIGDFIRIDFFITRDKYYFGEFSLFPNGGEGQNLNRNGKKKFVYFWVPEIKLLLENNYSLEHEILKMF